MNEEIRQYFQPGKKNLILVYILYLCGILYLYGVVPPLLGIIGAVFAYINIELAQGIYRSHYVFLFRTFWISIIGLIIAKIMTVILIGPIISIIVKIWYTARIILGMNYLINEKAHSNPNTLLIK